MRRATALWLNVFLGFAMWMNGGLSWAQEEDSDDTAFEMPQFDWQDGPVMADLDGVAQIDLPAEYTFLNGDETRRLMELYGNLATNIEKGLVASRDNPYGWFLVFEFDEVGLVKDDDADELDAEAILQTFRDGSKEGNRRREEMGLPTMDLVGWRVPPNYDPQTHNLEWCLEFTSEGNPVLNHNVRLLGRRGVMNVTLVCNPEEFDSALQEMRGVINGYSFQEGQRYADWMSGDKVAEYGMAALVTGGALAVAAKSGILQKLLKPILLGLAVLGGGVVSFFKRWFGRRESPDDRDQA